MRRWSALIVLCCAGCTNAPLAGFLDLVSPSHLSRDLAVQNPPVVEPMAPTPPPPPGGRLLGPAPPPVVPVAPPADGNFSPPLNPGGSPALPPARPDVSPFTIPNT
jgi:hypothetical protein